MTSLLLFFTVTILRLFLRVRYWSKIAMRQASMCVHYTHGVGDYIAYSISRPLTAQTANIKLHIN